MTILTASLDSRDVAAHLSTLLTVDIPIDRFKAELRHLQKLFDRYTATSPPPFIAPDLIVTPEIRIQSELYLPIAKITHAYNRLYTAALGYPPILTSTPFHNALSWADLFVKLPQNLQFSTNPAHLLKQLLADRVLLTDFLFASFLPRRFYGGLNRYPEQQAYIREWLVQRKPVAVRCLDAACGTGEQTYGMALFLSEQGFLPEDIQVDGWTLEPLEVWAAAFLRFPHEPSYELHMRNAVASLFQSGYHSRIRFCCHDMLIRPANARGPFDLILCNGLLGGPIMHDPKEIGRVVGNLAHLLAPGGLLLAADNFHAGWKQRCPQKTLRASLETHGLICDAVGEGLCGLKPDEQTTPG